MQPDHTIKVFPAPRLGNVTATKRLLRWRALQFWDATTRAKRSMRVSSRSTRVLLVARNGLMAEYVLRVWACMEERRTLGAYLTRFRGATKRHEDLRKKLKVRWIPWRLSQLRDWDMLVLADHVPLSYPPSIPRVIVAHGVARSRLVGNGSYYYDKRHIYWPDGRPVYDVMFEASHQAREWAVNSVPDYSSRIHVVGDLRIDDLLAIDRLRDDSRARLGWANRRVVAIMSTWSTGGLIPTLGKELLMELDQLVRGPQYSVILTMHPNLWDKRRSGTDRWRQLVEPHEGDHFRVLRPDEDWALWLPLSDVAVTDHTSLAAAYSVLQRPMIPIHVPSSLIGQETFAQWLLATRESLSHPRQLKELLEHADETHSSRQNMPAVVDFPGEAGNRTRRVLLDVVRRTENGSRAT
jgi:CDP-Glycerol:Poly(glycerophosphate) glycerophosphotransferase